MMFTGTIPRHHGYSYRSGDITTTIASKVLFSQSETVISHFPAPQIARKPLLFFLSL